MAAQDIQIIAHPRGANRQYRQYVTKSVVSNAKFYSVGRTTRRNDGSSFTEPRRHPEDYNLAMDEPTNRMVDELFQSAAINELTLMEKEVSVTVHDFFFWSEVEPWIIACIKRRLGFESGDASPAISRKAIGVSSYLSSGKARYYYASTLVSGKRFMYEARRDLHGHPKFGYTGQPVDPKVRQLVERLFHNRAVGEVNVWHDHIDVRLRDGFRWDDDNVGDYVLDTFINYLDWNRQDVTIERYPSGMDSYERFLFWSNHPIDRYGE